MSEQLCPWWLGWTLSAPFRGWFHPSRRLFGRYVRAEMRVFDLGAGAGFFTTGLARLVGPGGRVVAVERRQEQLDRLWERVRRARFTDRVSAVLASGAGLGLEGTADFILAFWMLHEAHEPLRIIEQVREHLKPGGRFLLVEPRHWVGRAYFTEFTDMTAGMGLRELKRPRIAFSRAALFERPAD